MFTFTRTASHSAFIHRIERGVLTQHPDVAVCWVSFNPAAFDADSFRYHAITQPPQITQAVVKRQTEYLAGRYCCAQLPTALNYPADVASNADRSPCWPAGTHGAISHNQQQAIALLTASRQSWPGVDIETFDGQVMRDSAGLIAQPAERDFLRAGPLEFELALLLAFSAKLSATLLILNCNVVPRSEEKALPNSYFAITSYSV